MHGINPGALGLHGMDGRWGRSEHTATSACQWNNFRGAVRAGTPRWVCHRHAEYGPKYLISNMDQAVRQLGTELSVAQEEEGAGA